jgi:hypothetical protein
MYTCTSHSVYVGGAACCNLTHLSPNTAYMVKVRAKSEAGWGLWMKPNLSPLCKGGGGPLDRVCAFIEFLNRVFVCRFVFAFCLLVVFLFFLSFPCCLSSSLSPSSRCSLLSIHLPAGRPALFQQRSSGHLRALPHAHSHLVFPAPTPVCRANATLHRLTTKCVMGVDDGLFLLEAVHFDPFTKKWMVLAGLSVKRSVMECDVMGCDVM